MASKILSLLHLLAATLLISVFAFIFLTLGGVAEAGRTIVVANASEEFIPEQIVAQASDDGRCPKSYSKETFRGRTGRVAFFNQWTKPVTVVVYHPSNLEVFDRYTVPPKENRILFDGFVGDDWGVCFENLPSPTGFVNNLGQVSEYNPDWEGSPLFMIQNPRIRW